MVDTLRVLHVTPYFAPAFGYGGPPRSILGLCRALQQVGVRVHVFTTTANGREELPARATQYEGVPVRYFPRRFPQRFFAAAELSRALAAEARNFDVLHVHGLWNLPAWAAAKQARQSGVPYVLSPRGMLLASALAKGPVRKRVAYQLRERTNLASAALLHATSTAEARALERQRLGVEIVTLPNGVDTPTDTTRRHGGVRARLGLDAQTPLIAFVGRIHPIKRLDLLAAAFARVHAVRPRAHLVIAGPDEAGHRSTVEPLFAAAGAAASWTGALDEAEKWALLADTDVLVLCSASENFGLSVAEALAAGVPVVVTRTCPWEDVATYGCGYWVEPDAAAIADGIVQLLDDPSGAEAMGGRGRALIREKYAWSAIAPIMAAHYASVAQRRGASVSAA
jgi:glycosyltransferase involved in cell wall biosynthesis